MFDLDLIDSFCKEAMGRIEDLSKIQAKELGMWKEWKAGGEEPAGLQPLLRSFRPMIRQKANMFANNVDLPPAAVHAEFQQAAINAFKGYNPDKGAALGTWVNINLQKAQRWVAKYQNPARIQESRQYRIGEFQNATATLDNRLGRPPTVEELSEHLGWAPNTIRLLSSEIRKAHPSSGYEERGYDPTSVMPSAESEKLKLVKYELTPEETQVYEYTIGDGKPALKPGEIAQKLGWSPSKVSRIRNSIVAKMEKY